MVNGKKIGVISLGCDKNRVDAEKMISVLKKRHTIVTDPKEAEIIIINTCAFLESARKEAVEEILSAAQYKDAGKAEKIIVTGCLPQKYAGEIFDELAEADAFLGVSDYGNITEVIDRLYEEGKRINAVGAPCGEFTFERTLSTDGYAYLKIADGCSNHCTYCLIPYIRGKYRSADEELLIKEAKALGNVNELILVAQDTANYGSDLFPKKTLTSLIRSLSALDNVRSIRLLYCYPEHITDELINELKTNPKLIKYVDIPFQHADDGILKLMNRKGSGAEYLALAERLKKEVEGIAVRSTFIAGFPTESEEAFGRLVDFLKKAKLFNAGFFAYSREEGTAAARMDGQIPQAVKTKRVRKLYSVQREVVKQILDTFIEKTVTVLAEGFDGDALCYYGRAYFNAPSIDGKVYFFSSEEVEYGKYYEVRIAKADGYDLYGERI